MNVAFYCPLKPPDHPNPSGDRRLARLFIRAISMGGHRVMATPPFRSRDALGNRDRQRRIQRLGKRLARRLIHRWETCVPGDRPQIWFTYHVYHKAPDWLGPAVARALGIPYVVAEASVAPKRAGGPWDLGLQGTVQAVRAADAILSLNPDDEQCVRPMMKAGAEFMCFPPFIDTDHFEANVPRQEARSSLRETLGVDPGRPWLIAIGMMRHGDKLASYQMLGQALSLALDAEWTLLVVGDGAARAEVEQTLAPLGRERLRFLGRLESRSLANVLGACDLLVWPAINEAFGMSLLEAQALGVPVVAGGERGVSAVVKDGETGLLVEAGAPEAFTAAVRRLIESSDLRLRMGRAARERVLREHDLGMAARGLDRLFLRLRESSA